MPDGCAPFTGIEAPIPPSRPLWSTRFSVDPCAMPESPHVPSFGRRPASQGVNPIHGVTRMEPPRMATEKAVQG